MSNSTLQHYENTPSHSSRSFSFSRSNNSISDTHNSDIHISPIDDHSFSSISYPPSVYLGNTTNTFSTMSTKGPISTIPSLNSIDQIIALSISQTTRDIFGTLINQPHMSLDDKCPYEESLPLHGRVDRILPHNHWIYIPGLQWKRPPRVYQPDRPLLKPLIIPRDAIDLIDFAHIFHGTIWQFWLEDSKLIHDRDLQFGTPIYFAEEGERIQKHEYTYHLTRIRLCLEHTSYVEAVAFNSHNDIHTEGSLNMPPIVLLLPNNLLHNFKNQMFIAHCHQNWTTLMNRINNALLK